jgi:Holliday junction resolvase RusA-like endonuclease
VTVLTFDVVGRPAPQGSKSAVVVDGRARVLEGRTRGQRERHAEWRTAVAQAAWVAMAEARRTTPILGPVEVTCLVRMPRPKAAAKAWRWHHRQPDLDKIQRSIGDALQVGGVVGDDSQIARWVVEKVLCPDGEPQGATIRVRAVDHTEPPITFPAPFSGGAA